jgi:hypothetical protein
MFVALCAARSVEKPGDIYLDDAAHHALNNKFSIDFNNEGVWPRSVYESEAELIEQEETNNPAREEWERVYNGSTG